MGFYASASGDATIKEGMKEILEKVLDEKYGENGRNCSLDYDFDDNRIDIYDSEKYHEEDTEEFLDTIAPYITEGALNYSGEDDCIWRFVFDPASQSWNEEDAKIYYGLGEFSEDDLIAELQTRGYAVEKTSENQTEDSSIDYRNVAQRAINAFLEGCELEKNEIFECLDITEEEFCETMGFGLDEEGETL